MGQEQVGIQLIQIEDMSGGLNSAQLSSEMKDNESRDCENIIWRDGSLQKTPGATRYASQIGGTDSTKRITGIHDFQKWDTTQYLVVTTEDDIINFTTAPGTSILGGLTTTDSLHSFAGFNDKLSATNDADQPWVWDGTGNAVTLESVSGGTIGASFRAKYVATFNDRLVYINFIDNTGSYRSTEVAFSEIDDPYTFDLVDNTFNVESDDSQQATCGRQLGDAFFIYKENSISKVSGAGYYSWAVQRDFKKGIGCKAPHTLKTGYLMVGGNPIEVHIFLSNNGLVAFDGTNIHKLPIPDGKDDYKCFEYFDTLNKQRLGDAVGEYYEKRNWFFSFYTLSGQSTNTIGNVYDYGNNSLWPLTGINVSAVGTRLNTSTQQNDILIGSDDGNIYVISEDSDSVDSTTELITDGSMEAVGVANWGSYAGGTRVKTAVTHFNGAQGLQVGSAGPGQGTTQTITTEIGKRYRAYAYVLSTAGAAGAWQISALAGTTELDSDYLTHSTTTWVEGTLEFTATTASTEIRIEDRRGAGGTMVVDDVAVRCCDLNSYWESKDYSFGDEETLKLLREFVPFGYTSQAEVQFILTFNKGKGTTTDTLDLTGNDPIWNQFVWNTILWGGSEETQDDLPNLSQDAFRTVRIKLSNPYGGQPMRFTKFYLSAMIMGRRWFA